MSPRFAAAICGFLGDIMAIGDPDVFCNLRANALNALPDVQEACFSPLASC
jgi:hypothetical protein